MNTAAPILIVGNQGGMNVGECLRRAAERSGFSVIYANAFKAFQAPRWLTRFYWHILGHSPVHLDQFSKEVIKFVDKHHPKLLITTGLAPLNASAIQSIRSRNVNVAVYLTDDPWNPHLRSKWFFDALPHYSHVFTPRRQSIPDLQTIGCRNVVYLPFAYDPQFMYPPLNSDRPQDIPDVLLVGGADAERATILGELGKGGFNLGLYGDYWDRYTATKRYARGRATPDQLRTLTYHAKVNLCLVRRANRDGHVMRSFEIPACGGCMVAEDTEEHRAIFGREGEAVLYFNSTPEILSKTNELLANPVLRHQLAQNAYDLIRTGHHTYQARLRTMLDSSHDA